MRRGFLLGAAAALGARALMQRLLLAQLRRNLAALNAGDYGPLLANYADDAVLHFNDGPHRWAGEHRGRAAIERFLQEFVGAGLKGEILGLWTGGPPWAMTMAVRFDDEARAGGERLYANRVAMVIRTRWGRIVEQQDFYEDSGRILGLEQALREHGIQPVAA
jgi:ketosteroid isomerase-like protein